VRRLQPMFSSLLVPNARESSTATYTGTCIEVYRNSSYCRRLLDTLIGGEGLAKTEMRAPAHDIQDNVKEAKLVRAVLLATASPSESLSNDNSGLIRNLRKGLGGLYFFEVSVKWYCPTLKQRQSCRLPNFAEWRG
jgi:hypothetical protein